VRQCGGTEAIPEFKIIGGPAFAEIVVTLRYGQSIISDGGALQYMKGAVEHSSLATSGFLGKLLSGESAFGNKYVNNTENQVGTIAFASSYPGDAFAINMNPGDSWKLSRGAFVASSLSIKVSGKLNWRGAFVLGQEEGFVLPLVTCKGSPGVVFVSAYGGYAKHDVAKGDRILVNNGLFLACEGTVKYTVVKLGSTIINSVLGGEGLGMEFVGPCTVYTQSRNFNNLVSHIASRLPDRD
jgi:uncharacterized protein (TIGR00266 family)